MLLRGGRAGKRTQGSLITARRLAHLKEVFILVVLVARCSTAVAQPAIIPRLSRAPHDPDRTYTIVKDYFAEPSNGLFKIVRADSISRIIIVQRAVIDTRNWGEWAYRKLGPEHMLDTLENGTVTLTVKISRDGHNTSNVSIAADFKGTYGLAGAETTVQCVPKGVLENRVLQAVGASPQTG
jgi:hypothetical protein